MNCPQCNAEVTVDKKFCNKCGCKLETDNIEQSVSEVEAQTESAEPQPLIEETPTGGVCPHCSAPIKEEQKFCKKCGHKLEPEEQNEPVRPKSGIKTIVILAVCLVFVVAVAFVGYSLRDRLFAPQSQEIIVAESESSIVEASSAIVSEIESNSSQEPESTESTEDSSSKPEKIKSANPALFTTSIAIEPQYDLVYPFDENGLARVKQGNMWRLIDKYGNTVGRDDYASIDSFYEGLAVVCRNGKYGYIDTYGSEVIAPQWQKAYGFSDGLARVSDGRKYGYIDTYGSLITFGFRYTDAKAYSDGLAPVSNGGAWSPYSYSDLSSTSEWIICFYAGLEPFSEGLAACKTQDKGKWGYIDTDWYRRDTDKMYIIPDTYDVANPFVDGTAIVQKDGKQFHIDTTGKTVTAKVDKIWKFSDGYATALQNGKYGFVDRNTGRFAIEPQYVDVYSFADGVVPVATAKDFWFYVDANNEVQCGGKAWEEAFKFHDGVAKVKDMGLYGFIDINGNEIEPIQWEDATSMSQNMIGVCTGGKWGFLEVTPKSEYLFYE